MSKQFKKIKVVIVGGGTAGWLSAGILASHFAANSQQSVRVALVESPDVKTIGVGEGTWPSMRASLQKMGVSETQFIRECDVSLKQGSRFNAWAHGGDDYYYHPFSLPKGFNHMNLAEHWPAYKDTVNFADAVCSQSVICDRGLAPKQITTPEYAFHVNYGYHLDAGKFADFLKKHCINNLGVEHIEDHVIGVVSHENEDIKAIDLRLAGQLEADLFIDCSGFASLLLGQHYGVELQEQGDVLFNDSAIAFQVPYADMNDPVLPYTLSTAQTAGWIWDIGLPARRGVGYVYSSAHTTEEKALEEIRQYLSNSIGKQQAENLSYKKISITPGYREKFWHKNCLAIGLSAGFVEPLEASAIALVELSAKMLAEQFPSDRQAMEIIAKKFNQKFTYRWEQIIDFLKLHYVTTQRKDSSYWVDNCRPESIPDRLQESLHLWKTHVPWHFDTPQIDEIFPSASFQYVLYGMGFETDNKQLLRRDSEMMKIKADELFRENQQQLKKLLGVLPQNRELLNKVAEYGFQKN